MIKAMNDPYLGQTDARGVSKSVCVCVLQTKNVLVGMEDIYLKTFQWSIKTDYNVEKLLDEKQHFLSRCL